MATLKSTDRNRLIYAETVLLFEGLIQQLQRIVENGGNGDNGKTVSIKLEKFAFQWLPLKNILTAAKIGSQKKMEPIRSNQMRTPNRFDNFYSKTSRIH